MKKDKKVMIEAYLFYKGLVKPQIFKFEDQGHDLQVLGRGYRIMLDEKMRTPELVVIRKNNQVELISAEILDNIYKKKVKKHAKFL